MYLRLTRDKRRGLYRWTDQNPSQSTLFRDISTYILNQASQPVDEPAAKKRKLEENDVPQNKAPATSGTLISVTTKAFKTFPGVSFSIPQRKRFILELLDKKDGGIRAIGANGSVEFAIAWKNVDQVLCLPIPEKAKKQHNFVIIPVYGDGVAPVPDELKASPPEPIVWTFEEATGKNIVEGEDPGPGPMAEAIQHCLKQAGTGKQVIFPDADEFASAVPESHRKGEKAYHVKAHRGSKEGYLFFTEIGILYGFKKPLAFFDFAAINSISYTAVLRNTFNLVITTPTGDIEFGMLDQANFAGINDYVQKHGLQDASLADDRRAKKLNVNKVGGKKDVANGTEPEAAGEEEESELQKAERELQDQEDDEEEDDDFDPGSEGESEGSGSDSEDEEGEGGEGVYEEGDTVEGEYDEADGDEMEQ
ncbi:meiotically up-regulated gene 183 protein [Pyrenophora tritici-repentis Pt-1C-BFP]|uniref:Meiotically up-regulated gene 183 protein n=1 Tax=Pyrenophora tritici-repentis (strain Pt-1C-BFP) TaxID=426418 RepID=B2W0T6_PYRTR|nr:meiotically up-regulated gene 183 protein [Pyrenophora tritici-repentis Pt-1C-BFP]EDU46909.1 meiotically up-regulated gene 183 protein [Pyrenophora tritici-repentis Pt-1C-BFP]